MRDHPTTEFLKDWYETESWRNDQSVMYQVPHARERMKKIIALLQERVNDNRVLDVGCGRGMYTRMAATMGASEAVGVDIAQHNIDLARSEGFGRVRYFCQSWDNLAPGLTDFDVILATEVLEHALDPARLVKDLSERGKLVIASSPIAEPRVPNDPWAVQGHLHCFTPGTFTDLFDCYSKVQSTHDKLYGYVVAST